MFGLEEGGWEWVVDTTGGERVYDACKRVLRENGK
jgi:3'-phosphoadenosine 5'-phosphosulfate sulfotransferase